MDPFAAMTLILLRLAMSLAMFAVSGLCAYGCWTGRDHQIVVGAIGTIVAGIAGIIFAENALDKSLWSTPKPSRRNTDDDDFLIEETAIKQ